MTELFFITYLDEDGESHSQFVNATHTQQAADLWLQDGLGLESDFDPVVQPGEPDRHMWENVAIIRFINRDPDIPGPLLWNDWTFSGHFRENAGCAEIVGYLKRKDHG